ncbi:MAG: DUF362 domain-containing protein, partial [Chloroflexi bacterium]|nr:DUF362 domain-containing protein [Chloroflexota bacterium]
LIELAALAGLLIACGPSEVAQAPTAVSLANTPTPTPEPVAPTSDVQPTRTPTPVPTLRPVSPRPEIVKFHPAAPSRVVDVQHAGVWDGKDLNPRVIRQMLDTSITKLTGLNDAGAAWKALFRPTDRVAIKVNTLFSADCTHLALVLAVAECLQEAGVPAEQIVIFDRDSYEMTRAGYTIVKDGPGVRCYGTDSKAMGGWVIDKVKVTLSNILLDSDALINIPILTGVVFAGMGISFAMKNHYGTFNRPSTFHDARFERGVTELNAFHPIKERTRLVIGDVLNAKTYRSDLGRLVVGGSRILTSFDPVAHDTVGVQLAADAYAEMGLDAAAVTKQTTTWLTTASALGLGTNDSQHMDVVKVKLT